MEEKTRPGWLIPLFVTIIAAVGISVYWQSRTPDVAGESQQNASGNEASQLAEKKSQEFLAQQAAAEQQQAELAKQAAEKKAQEALAQQAAEKQKQAELAAQAAAEKKQAELAAQAAAEKKQAELAAQAAAEKKQAELAKQVAEKRAQELRAKEAAEKKAQEALALKAAEAKRQQETKRLAAEKAKQAELALLAATQKAQEEEAARQAALAEANKVKSFDVTGFYAAEITSNGQDRNVVMLVIGRKPEVTVELKQDGEKIKGKIAGSRIGDIEGIIKENRIEYEWYIFDGDGRVVPADGKGFWTISDDGLSLEGDWYGSSYSIGGAWNLKKQ